MVVTKQFIHDLNFLYLLLPLHGLACGLFVNISYTVVKNVYYVVVGFNVLVQVGKLGCSNLLYTYIFFFSLTYSISY